MGFFFFLMARSIPNFGIIIRFRSLLGVGTKNKKFQIKYEWWFKSFKMISLARAVAVGQFNDPVAIVTSMKRPSVGTASGKGGRKSERVATATGRGKRREAMGCHDDGKKARGGAVTTATGPGGGASGDSWVSNILTWAAVSVIDATFWGFDRGGFFRGLGSSGWDLL